MKVLFISAWYPTRYDSMAGLFVQKHAKAVNLYADVKVLYVHADENISDVEIVDQHIDGLNEIIVYYPIKSKYLITKLSKAFAYLKAYKKGFRYLAEKAYSPDILQANVLTRTGVIAYLYKKWKKTPYVIMEHWTRYLPANMSYTGFLKTKTTEFVVKKSFALMAVSTMLKDAMQKLKLNHECFYIVDNVVDDFFFENIEKEKREKKRILHISCFIERAKNVKGILSATKVLSMKRTDFELIIIGDGPDYNDVYQYYESLDFPKDTVRFLGERSPEDVSWWFQNSDFFVLFSNYETASVVVSESLSSGIPVVATPTGIIPDVINDTNGYIVNFNDEKILEEYMNTMLDNYQNYDSKKMREKAKEMYSFENVGKKLYNIYCENLGLNQP